MNDITTTLFTLPPDAKFLPLADLSPRLRARIGVAEEGQSVITRPGYRVMTRLVPGPLAELISEFRAPSLLTDAVLRFARANDEDPQELLDLTFDALATLVDARILVPEGSPDAQAPAPTLSAGQAFRNFEIEALVRSLEDSEVYRARGESGMVALKIARDDRVAVKAMLANEAQTLARLDGSDAPRLIEHAMDCERPYVAMEWCDGVSIATAAQQARASRDRRRLHRLVCKMLEVYARLHERGVLHGDIHPGNCLLRDDGRVVLVDFGNARTIGRDDATDIARTGIPQFFDPQMAAAVRDGGLPPAATTASEQYSIAVLAYLLLTGLPAIEAPAVQDQLLDRIAQGRAPLPFVARGVAAWPAVERVLGRALSCKPEDRFADVADFARAFSSARVPARRRSSRPVLDHEVERVRTLATSSDPLQHAWFALRAALALEDAELLAAADLLIRRAEPNWARHVVAAQIAHARSDVRMERKAADAFVAVAEPCDAALLAAVHIPALEEWTSPQLAALRTRVDLADVWLCALAYERFGDERFKTLALSAPLPRQPLLRAFALLRLYQLTGDMRWVARARRVRVNEPLDAALLAAELMAPERAALLFHDRRTAPGCRCPSGSSGN